MTPAEQTRGRGWRSTRRIKPGARRCRPTPGPPRRSRAIRTRARQTLEIGGVDVPQGRQGGAAAGHRPRCLRPHAGRPQATIERLYIDYEDGAHVAVTIDDDPGQELFRETGRYLFFKAGELEAVERDEPARVQPQILVAGIGNAWMRDDGFGGHVAKALEERELPEGVTVLDFGTGGLDLAYEVMRGYDALVLVDVSRQGGEPGTLYVIEPDPAEITPIEDGEVVSPHGMDPKTVLRFVKTVGGWPGKVVVVACEPRERSRRWGSSSRRRSPARSSAPRTWCSRRSSELRTDAAYAEELMHELSISSAIVDTALRHAAGRQVTRSTSGSARCARSCPSRSPSTSRSSPATPRARGRALELEIVTALDGLRRLRQRVGPGADPEPDGGRGRCRPVPLPACLSRGRRRWSRATSSRSSRSRCQTGTAATN